ncbi:glycosyltransferase family 2 protein [Siccirubricoccus sp. KC 17139]|uniref:Glycosyltransferase family 2 protein n=1 Tax=Siccirubricoccus soli TaxID=2899147 RepID=A0ABT1D616_9PROT|nr:glycosyltransferase family 2 protein [Siccirubricoccus soli]MCO6417319.1 glycosyltransferase family 2 protein [Siccirubricoccus soli]MCP2683454.1 glycosyltransferase family 2 protein [Siccirubricoccus soli]
MMDRPDAAAPRVTVVIPNWNGAHLLPACLESLRRQNFRDFEVVVVENGSTDASAALLARDYPEVRVVALPRNFGFARGVNAGIARARGEWVALLNNDTEAAPDWLAAAMAELDRRPEVSFAASKLLDFRDRKVIDCVADGFTLYGVPCKIGEGERDAGQYAAPFPILSACAAASFYRRALFAEIGDFDADFFAYVEDVDLALRAVLGGHKGIAIPAARVFHLGTASTGGAPTGFTIRLSARNCLWAFFKAMPWPLLPLAFPLALAGQAGMVAQGFTGRRPWLRQNLGAYFRGAAEGFAGLPGIWRKRRAIRRRIGTLAFLRLLLRAEAQWRAGRRRARAVALAPRPVSA